MFLVVLFLGLAILATATPLTEKKSETCDNYKKAALNLANLVRKELHMFIITPPWAYQRSYTTNRNAFERGS